MVSRFNSLQLSLPLACILLLIGCSSLPDKPTDVPYTTSDFRMLREKEMQMTWVGLPYADLIQVFGIPNMIMNVPAYRPWKVSVVVYEGFDPDSNCIDAFTVVHSSKPVVDDYFCR